MEKEYPNEQLKVILKALVEKQAFDIKILDVRKLTWVTDLFVIASVDTITQAKAVVEALTIEEKRLRPHAIEGEGSAQWVLFDYGDILLHLFLPGVRSLYSLEKLWFDAEDISSAFVSSFLQTR
jgi:ribosome-associated protein